jgi:hypothetical protein
MAQSLRANFFNNTDWVDSKLLPIQTNSKNLASKLKAIGLSVPLLRIDRWNLLIAWLNNPLNQPTTVSVLPIGVNSQTNLDFGFNIQLARERNENIQQVFASIEFSGSSFDLVALPTTPDSIFFREGIMVINKENCVVGQFVLATKITGLLSFGADEFINNSYLIFRIVHFTTSHLTLAYEGFSSKKRDFNQISMDEVIIQMPNCLLVAKDKLAEAFLREFGIKKSTKTNSVEEKGWFGKPYACNTYHQAYL